MRSIFLWTALSASALLCSCSNTEQTLPDFSEGGASASANGATSGVVTGAGADASTSTTASGAGPSGSGGASATTTTTSGATTTTTTTTTAGVGGAGSGGGNGGSGGDPYDTPVQCSSNSNYVTGNNVNMAPGRGCNTCHVLGGAASGKTFDIGGTVYATAHEPDDCNGVSVAGATVVITDANNMELSLAVNAAGNFYHEDLFGFAAIKKPLSARVEYGGKTRKMVASIADGNCNGCHTEQGAQNAPGRIMLP